MEHDCSASLHETQRHRLLWLSSNRLCNAGVTSIYPTTAEMRRANLRTLVQQAGSQVALAGLLNVTPAQISQWLKGAPDSRTGKPRTIGDESARRLEAVSARPPGWMDHDHSGQALPDPACAPPALPAALTALGLALARDMPEDVRDDVADTLAKLARRRGAERHQHELLTLLTTAPEKRTGTRG